jgi:DNA-binding Xre family transcriptional regulator
MIAPYGMPARFRLRELLEDAGVSQSEFARDSGISFATINRLCNRPPEQIALETIDKVLSALAARGREVSVGDLIEWTAPKRRGRG